MWRRRRKHLPYGALLCMALPVVPTTTVTTARSAAVAVTVAVTVVIVILILSYAARAATALIKLNEVGKWWKSNATEK